MSEAFLFNLISHSGSLVILVLNWIVVILTLRSGKGLAGVLMLAGTVLTTVSLVAGIAYSVFQFRATSVFWGWGPFFICGTVGSLLFYSGLVMLALRGFGQGRRVEELEALARAQAAELQELRERGR